MGATTLMSLAEFERLEGDDDLELLKGELLRMPPPERRHMQICRRIFMRLVAAREEVRRQHPDSPLGEVEMEMGYLLSSDPSSWLRPDVSIPAAGQPGDRYYEGAPLLAVEVVSPGDTAVKLEEKVLAYLAHGAAEVWVIYPESRHARIYRANGEVLRETESLRTGLLPGIEIPLNEIL